MAARRGAKVGIVLVVVLMVLVGVFFVADRLAADAAEDRIAREAQQELTANEITSEGTPRVQIAGFPFLTQVLGGEYRKITISLTKPKINNVQLNALDVVARTVRADARSLMNGTGEVVADEIEGTATMDWQNVRALLEVAGLPSAIDPAQLDLKIVNNKIELRVPLAIQNYRINLIAKGSMVVEAGKVRLQLEEVSSDQGSVPQFVQNIVKQNQDRLQVALRLPGLPYNLVVNKVETSDAGMLIIASAQDVKLAA